MTEPHPLLLALAAAQAAYYGAAATATLAGLAGLDYEPPEVSAVRAAWHAAAQGVEDAGIPWDPEVYARLLADAQDAQDALRRTPTA